MSSQSKQEMMQQMSNPQQVTDNTGQMNNSQINLSNDNVLPTSQQQEAQSSSSGGSQQNQSNDKPKPKRTGRRKIAIEFIKDKSRRHITFSKRKAGIMKKAYELSTLTGTQVLLLVASETGHVYTFATPKLQPLITQTEGKNLIQSCLNAPDIPMQQLQNEEDEEEDHEGEIGLGQQMGYMQPTGMIGGEQQDVKPNIAALQSNANMLPSISDQQSTGSGMYNPQQQQQYQQRFMQENSPQQQRVMINQQQPQNQQYQNMQQQQPNYQQYQQQMMFNQQNFQQQPTTQFHQYHGQ
ncbi:hypothetical protein ABK040_001596 [Willaertia magna]